MLILVAPNQLPLAAFALHILSGLVAPLRSALLARSAPPEARARALSAASALDMALKTVGLPAVACRL